MTDDPQLVIDRCFADLQSNVAADAILARLRAIEAAATTPPVKVRMLHARAIALNRLGFAGEALGDLHEAAGILEPLGGTGYQSELSGVFRSIALVHSWRGESREAALALLRAIAEADPIADRLQIALALIEAGRLQMEIGHPRDAKALLQRGLRSGETPLPTPERQRAWVNLLQALVATGNTEEARRLIAGEAEALQGASARLRLLAQIERSRIRRAAGEIAAAADALVSAAALAPDAADAFEHVEIAQARAELLLQEKNAAAAVDILTDVISRYADDDLASREVVARLMQAQALDAAGDTEEADRMLAAALRRALDRGLAGYVDQVRSRLAARGAGQTAWRDEESPGGTSRVRSSADRFVRQRPLGAGGFASVMRAYDLELGAEVALKKSALEGVYDTARRNRLLQAARTELQAAARIEHPGVARIYGLLTEDNGDAILIEEFIEGVSLRQAMAQSIGRARALTILSRIAFALAAVHDAGILHRDIKPENILLRPSDAPVVVDFGIALLAEQGRRHGRAGTVMYMSPEQARGDEIDQRSDLYSLALLACEMLLGERPPNSAGFLGGAWLNLSGMHRLKRRLIGEGLDPALARMLARSLSPHRHWRPASVAGVGRALAQAAADLAKAGA